MTSLFVLLLLAAFPLVAAAAPSSPEAPAAQTPPTAPGDASEQQRVSITPEQLFALTAGEAEKGNASAMLSMGTYYEQGIGAGRNFSKAMEWYRKAADAGLPAGFYNLGVCYEVGMGTAVDMAQAAEQFRKAAELKLPQAMFKMASLYETGSGVPKDDARAVQYLTDAAGAGHALSASLLGMAYLQGRLGQEKDGEKAVAMFTLAAGQGDLESMKNLGVIFKDGIERPASPQTAMQWYLIAQECGYPREGLEPILAELRKTMTKDQVKKAETGALKWVEAAKAKASAANKTQ